MRYIPTKTNADVLLALGQKAQGTADLARAVDVSYGHARTALKKLAHEGLAVAKARRYRLSAKGRRMADLLAQIAEI